MMKRGYEPPPGTAELLSSAERALHEVLTTGGVVRLRHGEKWMEYAPVNINELRAYIASLRTGRTTTVRLNGSKGL